MSDVQKQQKRFLALENADAIYCAQYIHKQLNNKSGKLAGINFKAIDELNEIENTYESLFQKYKETGQYEPEMSYMDAVMQFAEKYLTAEIIVKMNAALRQNRRRRLGRGVTITISKESHKMLSALAEENNETLSECLERALHQRYKNLMKKTI